MAIIQWISVRRSGTLVLQSNQIIILLLGTQQTQQTKALLKLINTFFIIFYSISLGAKGKGKKKAY